MLSAPPDKATARRGARSNGANLFIAAAKAAPTSLFVRPEPLIATSSSRTTEALAFLSGFVFDALGRIRKYFG